MLEIEKTMIASIAKHCGFVKCLPSISTGVRYLYSLCYKCYMYCNHGHVIHLLLYRPFFCYEYSGAPEYKSIQDHLSKLKIAISKQLDTLEWSQVDLRVNLRVILRASALCY